MRHFAVLLLALAAAPLTAQNSDTTPPQLASFSFSPTAVDVSTAAKSVTVSATVTDDLSGVSYPYVYFYSPRGQFVHVSLTRISGDSLSGAYQGQLTVPIYAEPGVWKPTFYAYDNAGNRLTLNPTALTNLGFPASLTVTNTIPDTLPPTLVGVTFSPASVDTSSGTVDVTVRMHVTDNLSGVTTAYSSWWLVLRSPEPTGSANLRYVPARNFHLVSGTVFDGTWEAVMTMPRYSPAGEWTISYTNIYDGVSNLSFMTSAQLAAAGINSTLSVTSTPADTTAPVLTGLALSPPLFNTSTGSHAVTLTVTATDDLSGVSFAPTTPTSAYIQFSFTSPSGNQQVYVSPFSPATLVGGTPLAGTWQLSATFPRYSEEGTWNLYIYQFKDAVGNTRTYSASMLKSMGLPSSIVVTKPSLVTDGTVGPEGGTVTDNSFGDRASVTFPTGIAPSGTNVSIDVFPNELAVPTPQGFTMPGTYFTNISFTPPLASPLPFPGITIVLPLRTPVLAGAHLSLYHIDPISGKLAPAMDAFHNFVTGTVNADQVSATFLNVVTLSTVVGYLSNGSVVGDVDGNGIVNCADVSLVKASYGKRTGQPGYNLAADINSDGVVDIRDLFVVTRKLPAGTTCQ